MREAAHRIARQVKTKGVLLREIVAQLNQDTGTTRTLGQIEAVLGNAGIPIIPLDMGSGKRRREGVGVRVESFGALPTMSAVWEAVRRVAQQYRSDAVLLREIVAQLNQDTGSTWTLGQAQAVLRNAGIPTTPLYMGGSKHRRQGEGVRVDAFGALPSLRPLPSLTDLQVVWEAIRRIAQQYETEGTLLREVVEQLNRLNQDARVIWTRDRVESALRNAGIPIALLDMGRGKSRRQGAGVTVADLDRHGPREEASPSGQPPAGPLPTSNGE
ncbi:hypothetical protein [Streptomyces sp. NPDC002403]